MFPSIDIVDARKWAAHQLNRSAGFLQPLKSHLHLFSSAWVVTDQPSLKGRPLDDTGGVQSQAKLSELIEALLADAVAKDLATVIVEDDLHVKNDFQATIEPGVCFFGDIVVRYADLAADVDCGTRTLLNGSSGYPLNAVLAAGSYDSLGLVQRADVPVALRDRLLTSASRLITSLWDAEALLVLSK